MLEKIREAQIKGRISDGLERGYRTMRDHIGGTRLSWLDAANRMQEVVIGDKKDINMIFGLLPRDRKIAVYFGSADEPEVYWAPTWKRV